MSLMDFLRGFLRKKGASQTRKIEYVRAYDFGEEPPPEDVSPGHHRLLSEVDFSYQGDLEAYVDGLTVPRQVIEHWVSTGLLFPEEIKVAKKIIKIMIKKEQSHQA
jgi:hypothetical protein